MKRKITIEISKTNQEIADCVEKTSDTLKSLRVNSRTVMMFSLYLEELLMHICTDASETEDKITVQIKHWLDEVSIYVFVKGQEIPLDGKKVVSSSSMRDLYEMEEADISEELNKKLLLSGMDNISYKYKHGVNTYQLMVIRSQYEMLHKVLLAMALGLLTGLLLKLLFPENIETYISENIFQTISGMFLNAIKMIIGPMIFCSIAYSISSYTDITFLQKIGKSTIAYYIINALIGIGLATLICFIFKPGVTHMAVDFSSLESDVIVDTPVEIKNIWKTIGGIVSSNIFNSFSSSNILQIIFIATLFGAAVGINGSKCLIIKDNLNALDKAFNKMVMFIMIFLPVMVFCSMARMVMKIGFSTILLILYWIFLIFLAYTLMIFIYSLIVWISTGTSPVKYFKKIISCLLIAFSMGSSSACMSTTINTCEKDLKIKNSIYSFCIPLGISIHSCSSCIFYIISVVFLNNLYTGQNTLNQLGLLFFFSVFMLALGAPSVSGAGPICVATLLATLGAPMECIALIIAWDPIISTIKTSCSCMEDLSVAYILNKKLK